MFLVKRRCIKIGIPIPSEVILTNIMTSRCITDLFVNEFNEFEDTKCLEQINLKKLVIMTKTTSI